ncbi:response regulator transcription factor [Photobacterium sp. 1_MG-2023]|uniref:response regulator transcription factor n=1 Tax=Photobacterium sp. 1_MG-2023 TaxID=3062646 RepID=UPI0026E291E1|nr:response regulator transcription factor [Photobacterium sp. 1_MG-2023]MDO6705438.1 response regulator transcription factor [Photobacterium sp. 1_MG-2023]
MMTNIRVLLVDDHQVVMQGFQARLDNEKNIDVVATATNGAEALKQAQLHQPDVVLMDISMPEMNGIEATRIFRRDFPAIKVLILTMHDNREYILQVMQAGASGYILKEVSAEEMVQAIEAVHQGGSYFCRLVANTLFSAPIEPQSAPQPSPVIALSRREETILRQVASGKSSKKIALELGISTRTVETHRQNIKHKLNLNSTAEMTAYAVKENLI